MLAALGARALSHLLLRAPRSSKVVAHRPSAANDLPHYVERHHERLGIENRWLKAEPAVEGDCALVERVHGHGPDCQLVRGTRNATERFEEQAATEADALVRAVDREPSEQRNRDRECLDSPRRTAAVAELCST